MGYSSAQCGNSYGIMANATKAQLNSVSRQLTAKAQSWGQVAKQLSGMKGKVALSKTEKITIQQAFNLLGVHTKGNKYTAQDLGLAWSERLKEGESMHSVDSFAMTDNSWRCPLLCKAVPMTAQVADGEHKLYYVEDGEYKMHKVQTLCRVVKAEDKEKGSNDVIVTAQVVLRGLVQSIFVEDTLKGLAESQKEAAKVSKAFINLGDATAPNFVEVIKSAQGVWSLAESKKAVVEVEVKTTPKKTTKRNSKKAA